MDREFDYELMEQDFNEIKKTFLSLFKSFGKSPTQYSASENIRIQYEMWKVDMGPVRLIKVVVTLVVFLIWLFVLFIHSDIIFKFLELVGILYFYGWLWADEFEADKDGKQARKNGLIDKLANAIVGGIKKLFSKKEEKKK